MPPPFLGPPGASKINEQYKEPLPKHLKEVPGYLKRLLSGFFSRLFFIFRIVWETNPWILLAMVMLSLLNGVVPVIGSIINAAVLNQLAEAYTAAVQQTAFDFNRIVFVLVIFCVYQFVSRMLGNVDVILTRISGEKVTNHIKLKIMNKAKEVDLGNFDLPGFYEKLENANREAGMRPVQILNSTFSLMSSMISMVSYVIVLSAIAWFAPLLIVLLSIPSAIVTFIYRKKNVMYMRHRSKDRRQMNYYSDVMVNKDMAKEVRMFGLSDTLIGRYQTVFKKYFGGMKKLIYGEGGWNTAFSVVSTAVHAALFLFIAQMVYRGEVQVGDYSLYTGALSAIAGGVAALITSSSVVYEGTLFIENLIAFLKVKSHIVPRLAEPAVLQRHTAHSFRFEHVSFRYPGTDVDVLKDINFEICGGETLVLVGLNGAGKTTLLKLLTRLYDPTEGVIYLDGRDIRDYDVAELYRAFGIIFQDFGKYAVSVEENIRFGAIERDYDEQAVHAAAKQSNAAVFIEKLPDGYQTPLMRYFEENGTELSIGQWQKLCIARAFYSDADILILDEPTASLDAIAEQEIFSQFDELRQGKTTIFVSHRLSSATTASKIVVLQYGQIVEEGTHEELMAAGGHYCTLFSTQAKRYVESAERIKPSAPNFLPKP